MRLAIASPSSSAYSETFIQMQMESLPCCFRVHGGPVASETQPGGPITPQATIRGLLDTAYWCGIKRTRWEGPQRAELKRRLRKARISVLLANYGPTGIALLPICQDLGIPLIVHFHGYDAHVDSVAGPYRERYEMLGRYSAAIIAVSYCMKETLISYGIPATKIRVLRCGVDPDHFTLRSRIPKNPMFFSVGRFTEKKAPYLTVLAFAEARQVLPEARLVLAGDGELLEATANLAIALDISKSVEFVGVQTPAQVADWMGQATALVQHSITPRFGPKAGDKEGTPVAVMEAMMSGLPVIGTNHAGIGEIVEHRKTGLLVEERDIHAMAKAMIEIHSDPVVAARLGATAREKAVQIYSKGFYIAALESLCIAESSAEH